MKQYLFFLMALCLAFSFSVKAETLNLLSLGNFLPGDNNYGWNPSGFVDGNPSTYGLDRGHYPNDGNPPYTFRYQFLSAQKVDILKVYYLGDDDEDPINVNIYTTGSTIYNQFHCPTNEWRTYTVNSFVTYIDFIGPVGGRFSVGEVEMQTTTSVPEASSWVFLSLACMLLIAYRRI